MTLVLDIVLAGIFVVLVAGAAKKGFVLTVLEVVAIIAALFCASYISEPIAQSSYDMFLKGNIVKTIDSEIDEKTVSANLGDVAFDAIPEYAVTFAECAGIDTNSVKTNINSTISKAVQNGKTNKIGEKIEENCIRPIAVPAIRIILFFIMFVILLLVFRLLAKVVSKAVRLPLVRTLDTALGGLIGALRGAVVLIIISTVFVTMLSGGDSDFAVAVRESKIIELVNGINPFVGKLQELFQ
ncbi:MAG: CvpA family protein [Oscillospiraceae bacterium]|nr:CvpA family protein [Oscillospiraceae bacterium]